MVKKGRRSKELTFEDLNGLRAAGYIRDSKLDQRDGFGPEIQRRNIERFAASYGLELGDMWYTEFVSGRSTKNRHQFQKFLEDGRQDLFDVLLVFHTSRFGRNQADCIRQKEELARLGKILVFVSQGIISGSDRDFMNERMERDHGRTIQPQPLLQRYRGILGEGGPRICHWQAAIGLPDRKSAQWKGCIPGGRPQNPASIIGCAPGLFLR